MKQNLLNQWYPAIPYPTDDFPERMGSFIRAVAASAQASEALVGPVVLAAAAAAVQGVADIQTPYGTTMPTSIFVVVTARSGDGKSTVLKHVCKKFEEFERLASSSLIADGNFSEGEAHPFMLEEATENGVVDLYRQGARSLFYALDEGALLLRGRFDVPALCKRFDGGVIRHVSRKEGSIALADKRASLCLLTQDVTLQRYMDKHGPYLIESGFLPRVLMSAASTQPMNPRAYGKNSMKEDPSNHWFHQRVEELMSDYKNHLTGKKAQRELMTLSCDAEHAWNRFGQDIEYLLLGDSDWSDTRAFLRRAGEHVLRVAAVLQWFAAQRNVVEVWAMNAAINIVRWHLGEAKVSFGQPSEQLKNLELSELLLDYLQRKSLQNGGSYFARSDLLRCAPKLLRSADHLDIAISQLQQRCDIYIVIFKKKELVCLRSNFSIGNDLKLNLSFGLVG